jgi:hypothetical protein
MGFFKNLIDTLKESDISLADRLKKIAQGCKEEEVYVKEPC